jgi:amino acid adenylation domain-containing protein
MIDNENYLDKVAFTAAQGSALEDYWINKLSGDLVKTCFPYDYPRKNNERRLERMDFKITGNLFTRLMKLSNRSFPRLHIILIAAMAALLDKYTGSKDILLGTPIYKQEKDAEFINTVLVLRNRLNDGLTFKELLLQVRQTIIEADENQNFPIELLIQSLNKSYGVDDDFPLFDIIVLLENIQERSYVNHINTNMLFSFLQTGESLATVMEYNGFLYEKETVERIFGHFTRLLQWFLLESGVDAAISAVEILSEEEKTQLLVDFNNRQWEYPEDKTIHQLFELQVERTLHHTALAEVNANRFITYKELNKRANGVASWLFEKGIKQGCIAALLADPSIETTTGLLGILKAGAAYLPVDPETPPVRIKFLLKDSKVDILLSEGNDVSGVSGETKVMDLPSLVAGNKDMEPTCLTHLTHPAQLCYIIYTSGTIGNPKGVMVEHRGLVNYIWWAARQYVRNEWLDFPLYTSMAFDLTVTSIFTPLITGNKVIIYGDEKENRVGLIEKIIDDNRVGIVKVTPSHLKLIREKRVSENGACHIKRFIVGGEEFPSHLAGDIYRNFKGALEIYNEYGPTETVVGSMIYRYDGSCHNGNSVPIGVPIDNTGIYLLDSNGSPVCIGVGGEIYISGTGVARGYLNRPELTGERFFNYRSYRSHKSYSLYFSKKLYRTGDLARWLPDGNIEFLGRADDQVKIRGYRVEPMEVERQMVNHPLVQAAVVVVRGNNGTTGDDNKQLVGYIVPNGSSKCGSDSANTVPQLEESVRKYLKEYLPAYMVPSHIVKLERIPLTANGKLDRKVLPDPEIDVGKVIYAAPRNAVEEKLVEMWSELLGIDNDYIGIHANFFDLGGHSLLATRLVSRMHQEFNVRIPITEIFKSPRIIDLFQYLDKADEDRYISIKVVEEKEYYTQSSSQKRLYVLQELEGQSIAYNIPQVVVLEGEYKKEKLLETFGKLIQRHEALRTSFEMIGEEPVQRIHDVDEARFEIGYVSVERRAESVEFRKADIIKDFISPFDLSQQPLLRVGLIKIGETLQILIVDMHHIISDGVSNNILIEEFKQLHAGMELVPLRIQYKDYSEWQNWLVASGAMDRQKVFWLREFQGEIPVLHLPTDYPRPALQSFAGDHMLFSIPVEDGEGLKRLAKGHDATLFMVLLSVFNVLLAKLSSQEDIVVGIPIAGRRHIDLDHIVGMLINTLAIKIFPMAWKRFDNFLMEVKDKALEVFENQEYPFEDLVEEVEVHRDLSRNPLFDVMFAMDSDIDSRGQTALGFSSTVDDENVELVGDVFRVAKFDLYMTAKESVEPMVFSLEYCTRLFTRDTIERFIGHFKQVIRAVVGRPGREIREIEIIGEAEKEQLLYGFNDTQVEYARDKTLHELFIQQVERHPDSIAIIGMGQVVDSYGAAPLPCYQVSLTYKELSDKSNRLARLLNEKGVKTGSIVGLMVKRSVEMMIGIWGIMKAGAAYLPIDMKFPKERVQYMLADSRAKVLLTAPAVQAEFKVEVRENSTGPIEMIDISNELSYSPLTFPLTLILGQISSANLAYVIYTSGSTGKPKGVMLEHRAVGNFIKGITDIIPFGERERILSLTTISFDIFGLETLLPLTVGSIVRIGSEEEQLDVEAAASTMQNEHITIFQVTPSRLQMLISYDEARKSLKNLRYLLVGGEAFPELLLEKTRAVTDARIFNMYGPTETTIWSTVKDLTDKVPLNIGTPIANTQIYILSSGGLLQPVGIYGELCIGGDGLARGYVNRPQLTAEKFVDYRFYMSSRTCISKKIYKTGDIAQWLPDGNIEFLGRIDHQLKIRGFRIEPGEIEVRLMKHEDINEAVVIDREDEAGEKYLCAYIVLGGKREEGLKLEVSELRSMLSSVLPDYMIPSYFVPVEYIPLSPSGKIDRKALPEPQLTSGSEYAYIAPISETEKKLVKVWAEVLKLDEQVIGIRSNFFELGGHSLKAIHLVGKIHEEFNVKIPINKIFQMVTIEKLSRYIREAEKDKYASIEPVEKREYYLTSSAQKRLYAFHLKDPESIVFNMPMVYMLDDDVKVDKDKLESTIKKLIHRHENLRTSYAIIEGDTVQRIHDDVPFEIQYWEFSSSPNEVIRNFIQPFDLNTATLIRSGLIKTLDNMIILVIDMHHIISDATSLRVIVEDFMLLSSNKELPGLRLHYKEYAQWQNSEHQKEVIKKQEAYWLRKLESPLSVLNLPTDYPRPPVQSFEAGSTRFEIGIKETQALRQLCKKHDVTMFMILLAVYNVLLAKLSGQEDIIVGIAVEGRSHPDLERIIGLFINLLACPNHLPGTKTFVGFLKEVRENTLEAFENQDYQFEDLVGTILKKWDRNRHPFFDVIFNLVDQKEYVEESKPQQNDYEYLTSKCDIYLTGFETKKNLYLVFGYCRELFKSATMDLLARYYKDIISAVLDDPGKKISEMEIISEKEKDDMLDQFNEDLESQAYGLN